MKYVQFKVVWVCHFPNSLSTSVCGNGVQVDHVVRIVWQLSSHWFLCNISEWSGIRGSLDLGWLQDATELYYLERLEGLPCKQFLSSQLVVGGKLMVYTCGLWKWVIPAVFLPQVWFLWLHLGNCTELSILIAVKASWFVWHCWMVTCIVNFELNAMHDQPWIKWTVWPTLDRSKYVDLRPCNRLC